MEGLERMVDDVDEDEERNTNPKQYKKRKLNETDFAIPQPILKSTFQKDKNNNSMISQSASKFQNMNSDQYLHPNRKNMSGGIFERQSIALDKK